RRPRGAGIAAARNSPSRIRRQDAARQSRIAKAQEQIFLIGDLVGAPTSGNALTSRSKVRIANSLFLERFSLIRVRKFSVPLYREFDRKPLNWLETDAEVAGGEPDSSKIPCKFPC